MTDVTDPADSLKLAELAKEKFGVAAVMPTFVEQKSGHIVSTSSVAGPNAHPASAVYGGVKRQAWWYRTPSWPLWRLRSGRE